MQLAVWENLSAQSDLEITIQNFCVKLLIYGRDGQLCIDLISQAHTNKCQYIQNLLECVLDRPWT